MKLPSYAKKYFWEVDASKLDARKKSVYVLKRVLKYGDPKSLSWAWRAFPKKAWKEALASREVSEMTRNFWFSLLAKKR